MGIIESSSNTPSSNTESDCSVSPSTSDVVITRHIPCPSSSPTIPSSPSTSGFNNSGMPSPVSVPVSVPLTGPTNVPSSSPQNNSNAQLPLFRLINNRLHLVSSSNHNSARNSSNVSHTDIPITCSSKSDTSITEQISVDQFAQESEQFEQQYDIQVLLKTLDRRLKYAYMKVINGCEHMSYDQVKSVWPHLFISSSTINEKEDIKEEEENTCVQNIPVVDTSFGNNDNGSVVVEEEEERSALDILAGVAVCKHHDLHHGLLMSSNIFDSDDSDNYEDYHIGNEEEEERNKRRMVSKWSGLFNYYTTSSQTAETSQLSDNNWMERGLYPNLKEFTSGQWKKYCDLLSSSYPSPSGRSTTFVKEYMAEVRRVGRQDDTVFSQSLSDSNISASTDTANFSLSGPADSKEPVQGVKDDESVTYGILGPLRIPRSRISYLMREYNDECARQKLKSALEEEQKRLRMRKIISSSPVNSSHPHNSHSHSTVGKSGVPGSLGVGQVGIRGRRDVEMPPTPLFGGRHTIPTTTSTILSLTPKPTPAASNPMAKSAPISSSSSRSMNLFGNTGTGGGGAPPSPAIHSHPSPLSAPLSPLTPIPVLKNSHSSSVLNSGSTGGSGKGTMSMEQYSALLSQMNQVSQLAQISQLNQMSQKGHISHHGHHQNQSTRVTAGGMRKRNLHSSVPGVSDERSAKHLKIALESSFMTPAETDAQSSAVVDAPAGGDTVENADDLKSIADEYLVD